MIIHLKELARGTFVPPSVNRTLQKSPLFGRKHCASSVQTNGTLKLKQATRREIDSSRNCSDWVCITCWGKDVSSHPFQFLPGKFSGDVRIKEIGYLLGAGHSVMLALRSVMLHIAQHDADRGFAAFPVLKAAAGGAMERITFTALPWHTSLLFQITLGNSHELCLLGV